MDKDWALEVPSNAPFEDQFEKKINVKAERIAKNELQRSRNIAKAKDLKIPCFAKSSTASVGKFQEKSPHKKGTRGMTTITPGASSRKRKLPPVSGDEEENKFE
ncbi:hypothetical protein WA026_004255 [Henosepilachna vigintioctopunctata]|uniref:Ribosome biogenesis regulatory protein n=1 Tax=Henosepilachna vigintioctopunctata TaxID=420089 RepID=A0AAW1V006_9CUCU